MPTSKSLPPIPTSNPKTVAQVLGEVVWLMSQSPRHKQLFLSELEWFCMPAIVLEQFRMFQGTGRPAAVALWAQVSDEVDTRLTQSGGRLRPDEWRSGSRFWLIELVAPFGGDAEVIADLQESVFAGRSFKFHRTDAKGVREVVEITPRTAGASHH